MQKEREWAHLLRFKESCPFFPVGKIEATERPDFIVHTSNGLLGIEHTEIFQPGPPHGGSIQAQERLREYIVSRAENLYSENERGPVRVDVLFNPGIEIQKEDTIDIAEALASFVEESLPRSGQTAWLNPTLEGRQAFPPEVALIHIHRDQSYEASSWYAKSIGFPPVISSKDIEEKIGAKESKLDDYRTRCSAVWLLLVAAEYKIASTVELERSVWEHRYATEFDRVFFFWNFRRSFRELKLAKDVS